MVLATKFFSIRAALIIRGRVAFLACTDTMPFKKNSRPAYFLAAPLKPFWSSKVTSLEELKERISNHVLVGFDIEGHHGNTSEIGLAILAISGNTPYICLDRRQFSDENCIQAFTIDIQKRWKKHSEPKKHQIICVDNELQAGPACEKILAGFRGPFILVGYDLSTELKWISEKYPTFASYFSAWLDVQELVGRAYNGHFIGLTNALHGLGIIDNRHNYHYHSAANDAVRNLAILAHLLSGAKVAFQPPPPNKEEEVKRWSSLPHLRQYGPRTNYPFSARVSTTDGDALPDLTLEELANLYASYNLKAVAMNCKNQQRGKIWWLAFHTLESLKDFLRDFEGTVIKGKSLKVILAIGIEDTG